jgi:hypothetical protein
MQLENNMEQMTFSMPASARMATATENSFDNSYLGSLPLAMAYVPFQRWGRIYEPYLAFERGTIFPELDLPFCGKELV